MPSGGGRAMSALGQKQTFRIAIFMSALPPKADMQSRLSNMSDKARRLWRGQLRGVAASVKNCLTQKLV